MFLSCRTFVVIKPFSTGPVGIEVTSVSCLQQLSVGVNKLILTEIFPSVHETWYLNVLIKIILKWKKESETYLTHVCRHRWRRQITVKIDEIGAFKPTLSSAVDLYTLLFLPLLLCSTVFTEMTWWRNISQNRRRHSKNHFAFLLYFEVHSNGLMFLFSIVRN